MGREYDALIRRIHEVEAAADRQVTEMLEIVAGRDETIAGLRARVRELEKAHADAIEQWSKAEEREKSPPRE